MDSELLNSRRPATALALLLLLLAVFSWPTVAGRVVSLEWRVGNVRPAFFLLAGTWGVLAAFCFFARTRVSAILLRVIPTRRRLVLAATTVTLSGLLALGAVELVLRIIDYPFNPLDPRENFVLVRFDDELGWAYRPSASVVQDCGEPRQEYTTHIDDLGFRTARSGTRRDCTKPAILFVGGSYTMGHGLNWEETFVGRLDAPDAPLQCVNLGVQGYGTDQALLRLERHFDRFPVRAVVYTFIADHVHRNRVSDPRLLFRFSRFPGGKPRFALDPDGCLYEKERPELFLDRGYSRVLKSLEFAWVIKGPLPDLTLTKALVRRMQEFTETRNVPFLVVHWDQGGPLNRLSSEGAPLFRGTVEHLIETALDPPAGWENSLIPGDGHPDARAHARVAELIRTRLADLGLR
jgi:hypothetical protein